MKIKNELEKMDTLSIGKFAKGSWFDVIIVNMIAMVFVALGMFIPLLSFALAFIVMAYLQVGVYGFVLKSYRGENPDYESIFLPFKDLLKVLCIKIIVMSGMIIWGLLLIVPGIIYGLNNAFAGIIYFEEPNLSIKEILAKSKKLTYSRRGEIFLMVLGVIALVCLAASMGVGLHLLLSLLFKVPMWLTLMLIFLPAIVMLIVVALPLFESFLIAEYEEARKNPVSPKQKNNNQPQKAKQNKTTPKKVSKSK